MNIIKNFNFIKITIHLNYFQQNIYSKIPQIYFFIYYFIKWIIVIIMIKFLFIMKLIDLINFQIKLKDC